MAWIQPYFKDGDDGILAHSYVYQKNKKKQANKQKTQQPSRDFFEQEFNFKRKI